MKTEIEVKFLDIDHDDIRERLKHAGATLIVPMRMMRRVTIDTDVMQDKNAYMRVRDEGDKVTLTYKQFDDLSIDGAKEIEVQVSSFQDTIDLLAAAGLPYKSSQESKRETWDLGGTEIVLDEWPWLKPYIEIEGETETAIRQVAAQIGLDWNDAVFGDVMVAYRAQYPKLSMGDTIGNVPQARFGDPLPPVLE